MTVAVPTKTGVKQAFIDALRSGQYQQCKYVLKDSDGARCAMGVFHAINGDEDINNLEVSLKFHMSVFNHIALLNDTGKTFVEIAAILENGLSEDLQSLSYEH